jgi:hypothetical protein
MRLSQAVVILGGLLIIGFAAADDRDSPWYTYTGIIGGALITVSMLHDVLKRKR